MKVRLTKPYRESLLQSLKDLDLAAAYLNVALEEGELEYFLIALRNVADAHGGLKKVASKAKLNLTSLYRMLSKSGNPNLDSLESLLSAMNLKLTIEPRKKVLAAR